MKKNFKPVFLTVLLSFWALCLSPAAAEYTDTLRVGIYYGSGAADSVVFEGSAGLCIGVVTDRAFTPVTNPSAASVKTVSADKDSYLLVYSSHGTVEEATAALHNLQNTYPDSFIGYVNSSYCIMSGKYASLADAQAAADSLQAGVKPISLSDKALMVIDTNTEKSLFAFDCSDKGLGIYTADFENSDALLKISGSANGSYRGGFDLRRLSADKITVVNVVPVESYLYSVVCREMSPSWNVEALKAQAVCARNFVLGRIGYHSSYGFDVCRTVCCQAYSQEADRSENVHKAVDETRGELLFYEDELVQAVYSSSMGAYTENVKNVWGSEFPYLVSVENSYEDTENIYNGKWTKTLTKDRATEIMNTKGYNIGEVLDITITERTPVGGVLKLTVKGTNGSKTFERESCRSIFSEATYSQRYTVTKGGLSIKPILHIADGHDKTTSRTLGTAAVLTGSKATVTISNSCTVSDGKTTKTYKATDTPGDKNTFTFSGEGWGHGVGMSQYGAKGMADAGFGYKDILTHYYTGTHLEKCY